MTELGFTILVPKEVFEELKDLKKKSGISHDERAAIALAEELFVQNPPKKISLGQKKVDIGLIELGKKGAYIASLDNGVKRSVPHRIIIHAAQKKVAIERV